MTPNASPRICLVKTPGPKRGTTLRRFLRFVGRLGAWLPVLWRDEDYDYHHLLRIMKFKIGRMRQHIKKHQIVLDADTQAHRMKVAELVIGRILEAEYGDVDYAAIEAKWGELVVCPDGKMRHKYENDLNKDEVAQDLRAMMKKAEALEEADWFFL